MEPDTIYNFYLEAGGITDFGAALNELNQNLSLNETWKNDSLIFNPVLFFITDGFPTDNWELALENLITDNKWFNHATKLGIAIGEDADQQILAKITESNKTVIKIKDLSNFKELLEIMCTTAISNDSYKKSIGIEDALRILTEVQTTSESFAYSINFMHTTGIS